MWLRCIPSLHLLSPTEDTAGGPVSKFSSNHTRWEEFYKCEPSSAWRSLSWDLLSYWQLWCCPTPSQIHLTCCYVIYWCLVMIQNSCDSTTKLFRLWVKSPGQYIEVSSEQSPSLASALVCFFFFFSIIFPWTKYWKLVIISLIQYSWILLYDSYFSYNRLVISSYSVHVYVFVCAYFMYRYRYSFVVPDIRCWMILGSTWCERKNKQNNVHLLILRPVNMLD